MISSVSHFSDCMDKESEEYCAEADCEDRKMAKKCMKTCDKCKGKGGEKEDDDADDDDDDDNDDDDEDDDEEGDNGKMKLPIKVGLIH